MLEQGTLNTGLALQYEETFQPILFCHFSSILYLPVPELVARLKFIQKKNLNNKLEK